jgi:ABC-type sugar transport system ATPase subunit
LIPETKNGKYVQTALGNLKIYHSACPDGEVIATIRPESIQIGANGYNNLTGQVRAYTYRGSVAHCEARINDVRLHVAVHPTHSIVEGTDIDLHLPGECIFLLPKRETNDH